MAKKEVVVTAPRINKPPLKKEIRKDCSNNIIVITFITYYCLFCLECSL